MDDSSIIDSVKRVGTGGAGLGSAEAGVGAGCTVDCCMFWTNAVFAGGQNENADPMLELAAGGPAAFESAIP